MPRLVFHARSASSRQAPLCSPLRAAAAALLLALCVSGGSTASAQSATTGAVGGSVSDSGGAVLGNATVQVSNVATGAQRSVTTNSKGEYRVTDLQPGVYTVTVSAPGFGDFHEDLVTVSVGSVTTVAPKLGIGSTQQSVQVTDTAPAIHTDSPAIATTLDQHTIDNLPINGRRYSDFALLTPGVVSNSDGFGLLSFRGVSYLLNNTTVDGADDNQAYFSEARGRTRASYTISQASVQEFQVNTSNYSAEYGRAAGGVINTVTKSGSNQLHGELFFYDRDNSIGGASNPYTSVYNFDPVTGIHPQNVKPVDVRLQYGFGIGGAILRDKLFWFYGFDQQRRNFPGIARTTDPYDLLAVASPLSGQESCTSPGGANYGAPYFGYTSPSGTVYPAASVTANLSTPSSGTAASYPIGQSYQGNYGACALAAALAPNTVGALPYQQAMAYYNQGLGLIANFFGAVPRFQHQTINFPKLDYQINDRNRLTLEYNRLRDDAPDGVQTQTSNFDGRGSYGNDFVKADFGIVRFSTVVTNSIVNQALVQYGRDKETEFPSPLTPNELPLQNSLPAGECSAPHNGNCLPGAPDLSIGYGYDAAGFDAGTSSLFTRFALPDERRLQLKDDVTYSRGRHTLKFGVDYNKVSDYINNLYNGYGNYDYDWAYSYIGDYLHATTGLGGTAYAGGGGQGGYYNYGLYSSFSQGFAVPSAAGIVTNTGATSLIATREYAGYATDNWRVLPRLSLTLGVRYEYEYVPGNPTPNPNFIGTATPDSLLFTTAGVHAPNTLSRPDDRNNVAPRLGFAYNVRGDSKTVLRGGYGMYYGRIINANVEQSYQNSGGPNSQINISGLFSDASTATAGTAAAPGVCQLVFPRITTYANAAACAAATSNASSHPSISYLDSHLQNPQIHEADFDLQQDMGHGFVMGLSYLGSFGRELDSANDVNLSLGTSQLINYVVNNTNGIAPPTRALAQPHGGLPAPLFGPTTQVRVYTGTRIDSNYYRVLRISSNVNSKYNALAAQLNKRYSNGFSMLANFTWAHALDYNPYIGTGIPGPTQLDPNNQYKEYGNSSLDVRNRFVFAATYQPVTHFHGYRDALLGGWRVAPVWQVQTGLPYTPYVSGYPAQSASGVRSANGAGGTSGRIDAIRRNQYHRPVTDKVDLRVGKNFYIDYHHAGLDRLRLEFFAEAFNLVNHQNITGVQNTAYNLSSTGAGAGAVDTLTLQPNFGTYNNSNSNFVYTPRQIQLAARLHF